MTPTQSIVSLCICGDPLCTIPYGYCHCRCRRKAHVNRNGRPSQFIRGHHWGAGKVDFTDAALFKIDSVYCKLIPLTKGFYAIVDAADYEWLTQWKWMAYKYKMTWYALRREWIDGKYRIFYMHRVILGLNGDGLTDHESGIGFDNRRKNLREASFLQNSGNQQKRSSINSYLKGTRPSGARFEARFRHKYLGVFDTEEEAHEAYKVEALKYFGKFARFK